MTKSGFEIMKCFHFFFSLFRQLQQSVSFKSELYNNITKKKSGWYGWLVVGCSFFCVCVLDGVGYSFGVFFEPLLHDLGGDKGRGLLSIAGSLQVNKTFFLPKFPLTFL